MGKMDVVAERDGWRCWLCDEPVDPEMSVNDPRGPSSNVYLGLVANTPDLERQDVIFALDLGEENHRLLRRLAGRSGWVYGAGAEGEEHRLTRMPAPERVAESAPQPPSSGRLLRR